MLKKTELIQLEPEIIIINIKEAQQQSQQVLKIKNITANQINSIKFCLFNSKFEMIPQIFDLSPYQQKQLIVKIKLTDDDKNKRGSVKQFAYLKSEQINKRLTFLLNYRENKSFQQTKTYEIFESSGAVNILKNSEDQIFEKQASQIFSSRAHRNTQNIMLQKKIQEKDLYILELQKQIQKKNHELEGLRDSVSSRKKQESGQLENLIKKLNQIIKNKEQENQKQKKENTMLKINMERARKNEEQYQKLYEKQKMNFKNLQQQMQQNYIDKDLQQDYMKELNLKDEKIEQLELIILKLRQSMKLDTQRSLNALNIHIEEQKLKYQQNLLEYQRRIKQLEIIHQDSEMLENKILIYQNQILKKQQQKNHLKLQVESMKRTIKDLQNQKSMKLKLQSEITLINENFKNTQQKCQNYQNTIESQKSQLETIKIRLEIEQNKYLEIQKQSGSYDKIIHAIKNENEELKKYKLELERSINTLQKSEKLQKQKIQLIEDQLVRYQQYIKQLKAKCEELQKSLQNKVVTVSQLKKNEVSLQELDILKKKLIKSQEQKNQLQNQLKIKYDELQIFSKRLKNLQEDKIKIQEQTIQYKENIKKQLDHITKTSIYEMKKLLNEKKKLVQKINQFQKVQELNLNKSNSKAKIETRKLNRTDTNKILKKHAKTVQLKQIQNQKLNSIQQQINVIRNKLKTFKKENKSDLNSRSKQNIKIRTKSLMDEEMLEQLGQLRQFQKLVITQIKRINFQLRIKQNNEQNQKSIFRIINFFREIQQRIIMNNQLGKRSWKQEQIEYIEEIKNLKLKILDLECRFQQQNSQGIKTNYNQIRFDPGTTEKNSRLFEFIQQEMRNQYKKLSETIQLCHQKYQIFKKKIYNQYRSRIMQILLKKDRKQLQKLEPLLQKFIQTLSNVSHKQALLSKQTKKKNQVKRQNKNLKQKISSLDVLLQQKKSICTRDPVKIVYARREQDLYEAIKYESQLLSSIAQNQRLRQQLSILNQSNNNLTNQLRNSLEVLQMKQQQILNLKQQIVQIGHLQKKQLGKAYEDLQKMKMQYITLNATKQKMENVGGGNQKQIYQLKQQLNRKKDIIRSMKEKQKVVNQLIENLQRQKYEQKEKQKMRSRQQFRAQQYNNELKEKNKQLRQELEKKNQNQRRLQQQLEKKMVYISSMKSSSSTNKQKQKNQINSLTIQILNLKNQNKRLTDKNHQLKALNSKLQQNFQSAKQKYQDLQKMLNVTQNQLKSIDHDNLIKQKSFMSVIRGFIQILRRLWRYLQIKIRKNYPSFQISNFDQLVKDPMKLDMIKLYEAFEEILKKILDV